MKYAIEYILWHDAVSDDEWTSHTDVDAQTHLIESIGFLVKEDVDAVTLALANDPMGESVCLMLRIPKCMIAQRQAVKCIPE